MDAAVSNLSFLHPATGRAGFLNSLAASSDGQKILEIGPAHLPVFEGPSVYYFDVTDSTGLRERAARFEEDASRTPRRIHYVSEIADLSILPESTFDIVFSSHSIEHQVDFVRHLQLVSRALKPGGAYAVICPDRRYCFDAHIPESTIGDVVEAYELKRTRHRMSALVNQQVMTTHNVAARHWANDTPSIERFDPELVKIKVVAWRVAEGEGKYIDVHGYQFVPDSFRLITQCVFDMGLVDLAPKRVHDTILNSNEFCALLVKS